MNFFINNFTFEWKLNRTEYLWLLLFWLLIYPFSWLFIIIILTFFKLFDKNIMSNSVIIIISIIWLINLIIIWYRRYNDIFKEINLFFIYVISLFLLFYWWKFIWFFWFLWIIPILLLIFIPWKRAINFKIANNSFINENETLIQKLQFYKKYNYNFKNLLTFRFFFISFIFILIFSWLRDIPKEDIIFSICFLLIFLWFYFLIIFKDISILKNKEIDENIKELYDWYSYSKLLESIKNNINTDYSLNLLFKELMNDSLKLYNNKSNSFEKSILDDLTNLNENNIQLWLKIKESIKNIKETEIEKFFEKEIIYNTLELSYIIKYNDFYNNENNLVINELEELIKKEKNWIKLIKKLQKESKYIYNIILKELLGKDFKLLDEYWKVNSVVRFHFYNVFINSIVFHRLLKEEQDFFSIFFHILNPIWFLISKIIKFFRWY